MTWDHTYALIFMGASFGCANLFCSAPDRMQKLVLGLLMVGFALLYAYHCAGAAGLAAHWEIEGLGHHFIVWAVLIYIFRLIFIEHLSCKNLSAGSRRSPV